MKRTFVVLGVWLVGIGAATAGVAKPVKPGKTRVYTFVCPKNDNTQFGAATAVRPEIDKSAEGVCRTEWLPSKVESNVTKVQVKGSEEWVPFDCKGKYPTRAANNEQNQISCIQPVTCSARAGEFLVLAGGGFRCAKFAPSMPKACQQGSCNL